MPTFKKFSYASLDELHADIASMGYDLPVTGDMSPLLSPVTVFGKTLPNRLAVQPMEGCDGLEDGSPSELVYRRYERFAKGGCALIWVEACAVVKNARANPCQLWLHQGNVDAFARLTENIRRDCLEANGFEPYLVLQLTHSGRYSKPGDGPAIYAAENPYLDPYMPTAYPPHRITDDELEALEDDFVFAAKLAEKAGFDAVDIKACHRYLNNELLSAVTREGRYGGSFENRTRFLMNVVEKVGKNTGLDIAVRINSYDELPYPYGWCSSKENHRLFDLAEMITLTGMLYEKGVRLLNLTGGNPYYNPHVNRPYDACYYTPPVHQLHGIAKMLTAARKIRETLPADMTVISTGYSWLRELGSNIAAACIADGWFEMAGFGRQSFAYPDFARDIQSGGMQRGKCCIACGKCSEIMRNGGAAGCVIRDAKVYAPIYQKSLEGKAPFDGSRIAEHV